MGYMTERPAPIRTMLCDDHPVVRDGMRKNLEKQPDIRIVAEAGDGEEALSLFFSAAPDVAYMDLRMPKMDGVAAIREITARDPDARIIVLTQTDTDADVLRALEAGALGYQLKSAPVEDLVAALRAAADGGSPLHPGAARHLTLRQGPRNDLLTTREIEILRAIAAGSTTNKELRKALGMPEGTLKSHLENINRKLGTHDRTGALVEALKRDLLSLDP